MIRSLLKAALACAVALLAVVAAPAAAQTPLTFRVPVTQPDELGLPVDLDTDVYLPGGAAPAGGRPLVIMFHGGGNSKHDGFVVPRAEELVRHGYGVVAFSSRGHGDSSGQTTAFGPKEMRDVFDVIAWALGIGGRNQPPHPDFHLDSSRIALGGESQGGLFTNLSQAHSDDPSLNPYGIRFRALIPSNTPDYVYNALAPSNVVKLSFGLGLIETYLVGTGAKISPLVAKWVAALAADLPGLAGGDLCDSSVHDTLLSTTKADLAFRSPGCYVNKMTLPSYWVQAFDDGLFPPEMAISMWRRMPNPANRIYLMMGGHAAPFSPLSVDRDKLNSQVEFLDSILQPAAAGGQNSALAARAAKLIARGKKLIKRGKRLIRRGQRRRGKRLIRRGRALIKQGQQLLASIRGARAVQPEVVYWRRDPRVAVPNDAYRYPDASWTHHTSPTWPPAGTVEQTLQLSADGHAVGSGAGAGSLPLLPLSIDEANDPVTAAAMSATPIGTSPIPRQLPATSAPGFIAAFSTQPFTAVTELAGQVKASLGWTPLSPDTQVVVKLFDRAPDGTMTLLSRGVTGIRGAGPLAAQRIAVETNAMSALIPAGHSLVAWISAGELGFYKPYIPSLGGLLAAGPGSTISVPLRTP